MNLTWLAENKEWFLSGLGIVAISWFRDGIVALSKRLWSLISHKEPPTPIFIFPPDFKFKKITIEIEGKYMNANDSSNDISQTHSGSGDNIAGDKIFNIPNNNKARNTLNEKLTAFVEETHSTWRAFTPEKAERWALSFESLHDIVMAHKSFMVKLNHSNEFIAAYNKCVSDRQNNDTSSFERDVKILLNSLDRLLEELNA